MVDRAAFLASYEREVDALFRFSLSKVSDRELARDLVQETFARVWEYIAGGGEVQNMRAFLYKTLNNLIIDHYRRKKAVSLDVLQEDGFEIPVDMQTSMHESADGRRAMEKLRLLPETYRDVLIMRFVNGLELSEIAEICGETENAISVRIHRGLKKMKEMYDK